MIKGLYRKPIKKTGFNGYVDMWDETRGKYIPAHHKVLGDYTGIGFMESGWYIHHIDGDKHNNIPENLVAVPTNSDHKKIHDQLQETSYELIKLGIIKFNYSTKEYYIDPTSEINHLPESLNFGDVSLTQQKQTVEHRQDVDTYSEVIRGIKRPVPLIASNMSTVTNAAFCILLYSLGALGVLHRAAPEDYLVSEVRKISASCDISCASIGVGEAQILLAKKLIKAGANVIFIDVANGYSSMVTQTAKEISRISKEIKVVVGNVTNPEAMLDLGIFDAVKLGIAQGFACETAFTAGVTEGQFSVIKKFFRESKEWGTPIISDGGIRQPSDFVKSIAAGASAVMAGKVFAACPESAAPLIEVNGKNKKLYAGMASRYVQESWRGYVHNDSPEGTIKYLDVGENAEDLIKRYVGALRSGISYSGASNVNELQERAKFVRISQNGNH